MRMGLRGTDDETGRYKAAWRLNDGELGYRVETPSFKSLDT